MASLTRFCCRAPMRCGSFLARRKSAGVLDLTFQAPRNLTRVPAFHQLASFQRTRELFFGKGGKTMKIVAIGGTGRIGSKTVAILRRGGHEVVAASPQSGINSITGEGLKEAMTGTQVVIDLANSPSFEDKAVLEFFETSGRNLVAAEAAAGVRHHVALSIVGTDRTPENGYFRAKVAQEKLIETSGIPYTIIRSTQFLEFLGGIAASSADGNMVRLSPGLFQPIAADDVAAIVADVALAAPRSGIVEIAGPELAPFNEIVARYLKAVGDPREVVRDAEALYLGDVV